MLNKKEIELIESAREARDYAMRCRRIERGETRERDIRILRGFGKDIYHFFESRKDLSNYSKSREEKEKIKGRIMATSEGFTLAADTELRWLSSEEGPDEEAGKGLRELGIKTLTELGELLRTAETSDFQKYASALALYFEGYRAWADEHIALGNSLGPFRLPPSSIEKKMFEIA